ncbi:MAG: hypothetical protein WCG87_09695 [Bacteroidota bacterium]
MKQVFFLFVFTMCSVLGAQQVFAQSKLESWKELKAFHIVMSQTFHPCEEGDLKPIRMRSGEMMMKAKALASSTIPEDFNNQTIKDAVKKLAADSEKLHQLIQKKGTDDEVKKSIADLHDTFHLIVERCQKPEGHSDKK